MNILFQLLKFYMHIDNKTVHRKPEALLQKIL